MRVVNALPVSFSNSFYEPLIKRGLHLPSSAFTASLGYDEVLFQKEIAHEHEMEPVCMALRLDGARGIQYPVSAEAKNRVMERFVRIGFYDSFGMRFVGNTVILKANAGTLDKWDFATSQNGLIVVRVNRKELLHETVKVVFELVMECQAAVGTKEQCCGWAELSVGTLQDLKRKDKKGATRTQDLLVRAGAPGKEALSSVAETAGWKRKIRSAKERGMSFLKLECQDP